MTDIDLELSEVIPRPLDEILDELNGTHDPLNTHAFIELIQFQKTYDGLVELFNRIDAGTELPASVAGLLSLFEPWKELTQQLWPGATLFDNDIDFSLTRFILKTSTSNPRGLDSEVWAGASAQLRRMLEAGRIDSVQGIFSLFSCAAERGDNQTAIMIAAHTRFDHMGLLSAAHSRSSDLMRYADRIWPEIEAERERLTYKVWLRAYVSADEWAAVQDIHPDVFRALYPEVQADGYRGYVQKVTGEQS